MLTKARCLQQGARTITGPENRRTSSIVPDPAISDTTQNDHHAALSGEILPFLPYSLPCLCTVQDKQWSRS
jgi:hypothetical protein